MSAIEIREVSTASELKIFYQFQNKLYKDCPQYVPSLDIDQKKMLTQDAALEYCKVCKWLAYKDGKPAGRIMAMINPRFNELYRMQKGRFGWYDFIEDFNVAKALMDTARNWLHEQGMTQVHGPLSYNTAGKQGMLMEGFDKVPPFNCLYNYPYYVDYMQRMGFEKEEDWVQYYMDVRELDKVPERLSRLGRLLMEKYDLHFLDLRNIKDSELPELARKFAHAYNGAFSSVPNFIPFTEEEVGKLVKSFVKLLPPDVNCIIMDKDNDIAYFGFSLPSMSRALQKAGGNMFPLGWYHLLKAYRNYETIDMLLVGASPKWEGKGLSAICHTKLCQAYINKRTKFAICNPQIETNNAIKVWEESYNYRVYMRRRCWRADL